MFGLRKTLGSLLITVVFLVLAAFAAFIYNSDQKKTNELADNNLVKKGRETLGVLIGVSEKMTEVNVQKNIGMGKKMADFIGRVDWQGMLTGSSTKSVRDEMAGGGDEIEAVVEAGNSAENEINLEKSGFWSQTLAKIKEEWRQSREEGNLPVEVSDSDLGQAMFSYQKNDSGAEILIGSKTGSEYKLPLPFKFLSR